MASRKPEERVYHSALSISPFAVHQYYVPVTGFQSSTAHRQNFHFLDENEHAGRVSYKARKRLEKCIAWLMYGAKPKRVHCIESNKKFTFLINFITLTLPAVQVHSDQEITSTCLKNFLDVCRKQCSLENYIWRAEAQANGNIHFHLVTDCYIHYNSIRKYWNQSIELLGYVSSFELKHKHRNPNSTDVHSVKHIKRISSYLSKYMSKERAFSCIGELRIIDGVQCEVLYGSKQYRSEEANKKKGRVIGHVLGGRIRAINSRLWFASRSLTSAKNIRVDETEHRFCSVTELIDKCDYKVYYGQYVTSMYGDFCSVIRALDN